MKPQTQSVFAALADPTREAIVRLLIDHESSVGDIADRLPVSRPAVSKHLRLLQGAGIVSMRSEGTRNVYTLDPVALELVRNELDVLESLPEFLPNAVPAPAPGLEPRRRVPDGVPAELRTPRAQLTFLTIVTRRSHL